ncbi:MAG: histidine phosphatase family protein [Lachnospiraceae bacterium]|nr:histidine phosphatase family protein [Lachnospiraceae bacterium]
MLFFYIRHGDPIYNPDSLTPLGKRQAEAVAKRLALYGVDQIYASTSNRAILTAQPTCELLKKEMTLLDFCHENHAWEQLTVVKENGSKNWMFHDPETRRLFVSAELLKLGSRWYEHPDLKAYNFKAGIDRIQQEAENFLLTLGYEHIPGTGAYKVIRPNEERIALFAHQGFGLAFLSCMLDISYPQFTMHFDMGHTGMTVIEFKEENQIAMPRVLTLASDSHLYREGLPTNYQNEIRF